MEVTLDVFFNGLDSFSAFVIERYANITDQAGRMEEVVNHHRLEHIQFEVAGSAADIDSDIIAKDHADGQIINWNLGPMTMHVDCTVATAAWENNGSSGRQGKLKPRAWLESAVLRLQGDRWVMTFLHSTPKDPRP